ncbi:MAG: hypothetical protein ABI251_00560 [Mycobacteriaceae bacterium]
MNRTVSRPDLDYLRRRPRPGESPPTPAKPPTGSLSLAFGPPSSTASASAAPALTPKAAPQLPTPRVRGRTILTPERPMVTLDRRQSAIGSLAVDLAPHGQVNGVWELVDGTAGTVSEQGGITTSPEFGRRSLVQVQHGRLLVGLRHVHQLRRLLLVLTGLDPDGASTTSVASLYDGSTAESAHESHVPALVSLAIYQVEGELVVRREGFGFPSLAEAAKAYGFAPRWTPPLSR